MDRLIVRAHGERRGATVFAAAFMLACGTLLLTVLRDLETEGRRWSAFGSTGMVVVGVLSLGIGVYLAVSAANGWRAGGVILELDDRSLIIQGRLRRYRFDLAEVDHVRVRKVNRFNRLEAMRDGAVVAATALDPAEGSWFEIADRVNEALRSPG